MSSSPSLRERRLADRWQAPDNESQPGQALSLSHTIKLVAEALGFRLLFTGSVTYACAERMMQVRSQNADVNPVPVESKSSGQCREAAKRTEKMLIGDEGR